MYLKTLSLRGFKSFADATTLELEPGVTVIVGPNGSGKSNVVDAVAWVLGAQGPSVVRSSKMDDVIFAGTEKRSPLGRAEVSLTIDNSSRRLGIDLAEITITRTLFRNGESEYSMNGASCRLLDVQELLSDAGVGRQQHVIVSQGQLDSVLSARPEDRRAVIEEAAGVLKFRRRRERAERRLAATGENLTRLVDLQREVHRQLRPLERQSEAVRRHDEVAAELRGLRLYLAGEELRGLSGRLAASDELHAHLESDERRVVDELSRLDAVVGAAELALKTSPSVEVARDLSRGERLFERASSLSTIVAERRRAVDAALESIVSGDVVAATEAELSSLDNDLTVVVGALEELLGEGQALAAREAEIAELGSGQAAESGIVLGGDVTAARKRRDAAAAELAAAREDLARVAERELAVQHRKGELDRLVEALDEGSGDLSLELDTSRERLAAAEGLEGKAAAAVTECEERAREAALRAESLQVRQAALATALEEARARSGLERLGGEPGVLGTLLDLVEIDDGYEKAFEAAVDEALGAVVVEGTGVARRLLERLRSEGADGAVIPAGRAAWSASRPGATVTPVTPGATGWHAPAAETLRGRVRSSHEGVNALLDVLCAGVVVCTGELREALDLAEQGAFVVTSSGDRFSGRGWRLSSGRSGTSLAAVEEVERQAVAAATGAKEASRLAEAARAELSAARSSTSEATRLFDAACAERRQIEARRSDATARLAAAHHELEEAHDGHEAAAERAAALALELSRLEEELGSCEASERARRLAVEAATSRRSELDRLAAEVAVSRAHFEARGGALRERRELLVKRRGEILLKLEGYASARGESSRRRAALGQEDAYLLALGSLVSELGGELSGWLSSLAAESERRVAAEAETADRLRKTRAIRSGAEHELAAQRERRQKVEIDRTEIRVRLEAATDSLRSDLGCEPEEALSSECPVLPPGVTAAARVREVERDLRLMGPINPLAVEELEALKEREAFLGAQLDDVRSSRRELGRVMQAVDQEIVATFAEAFADVAGHFEALFSTLFPGGTGRLSLSDPTDLLGSGVEIEARPAGRNVRRLSLLSGGERSLVALAFLFAVFRSRPSPFYLMDEVEAALDDVNLHRFLDLVGEFRSESQLLVVSHQKRTMEAADIVYGVSMQPGGASKVVSERFQEDAIRPAS